jgi:hypothetical protein
MTRTRAHSYIESAVEIKTEIIFHATRLQLKNVFCIHRSFLLQTARARRFPLSEIGEAFRYFEEGHPSGKVVLTVEHN